MELLWVVVVNSYKCINETFTKKQDFDEKFELLIFENKITQTADINGLLCNG